MCTQELQDQLSIAYILGLGELSQTHFFERAHSLGHRKYISIIVWITNFVGEKAGFIRHSSLSLVSTTTCASDALFEKKQRECLKEIQILSRFKEAIL